jgi:hypothetical protein
MVNGSLIPRVLALGGREGRRKQWKALPKHGRTVFLPALNSRRRLQAVKATGLESIPAIFIEGNHDEIELIDNILKEDLTHHRDYAVY